MSSKHGITVSPSLYELLENIRKREGLRSIAAAVEFLAVKYAEQFAPKIEVLSK